MIYDEIESLAKSLSYRDKLHLAQTMLQMARKEEIEQNSTTAKHVAEFPDIVKRLQKLKPGKRKTLFNSVKTMFNFRDGIDDAEIDRVIDQLQKQNVIKIDELGKVFYL